MSSQPTEETTSTDYSKCYACSEPTRFYVSNHHRKYSHCTFFQRPYCTTCWSPEVNKYKIYCLGDHWIYHVQVNGQMLNINKELYAEYVQPELAKPLSQ